MFTRTIAGQRTFEEKKKKNISIRNEPDLLRCDFLLSVNNLVFNLLKEGGVIAVSGCKKVTEEMKQNFNKV